jgi:hypothetical protein
MFKTELDLRGLDGRPDLWALLAPLVWLLAGVATTVPAGFVTDLASIPAALRWALDVNGRSRRAAVLHDWLYALGLCTRAEADETLRLALIAEGESPAAARVYWLGVRTGGWVAWNAHRRAGGVTVASFLSPAAFNAWKAAA